MWCSGACGTIWSSGMRGGREGGEEGIKWRAPSPTPPPFFYLLKLPLGGGGIFCSLDMYLIM